MDTIDVSINHCNPISHLFIRLFSATETAFSSVNKIRLKNLASNGNKKAARALKMSENYDELLSTILVGKQYCQYSFLLFSDSVIYTFNRK